MEKFTSSSSSLLSSDIHLHCTWHALKVDQEGWHEDHLDGEDADGEDDDDPEEVVDGEHGRDGEGPEENPRDHGDEGKGIPRSASV